MPAHAKSTLSGVSLTIPITDGRLNMGTWQGIYFCEYRNYGGARKLVVTIIGEWDMAYTGRFGQSDDFRREELIRIIEHSVENLTLQELEALYYDMSTKNYIND